MSRRYGGRRRHVVALLVAGLGWWWLLALPASAHPTDAGLTDAEHAAQDLVGTPISTVEQQTAANARKITEVTGVRPGRRTAAATASRVERRAAAAASDPGVGGQWGAVTGTEVVPIFQAVLPNGKVLMWDSVGDNAAETYPDQTFTRAMLWNPEDDSYRRVDVQGYNIFCAGYVQLANGNVLVAGGNKDKDLNGIQQTHLFDWRTETWSRGPDMASGRWYPSVAALGNGEALIVAGGPSTAEVYQPDNTLRSLLGFSSFKDRLYPFLVPRPNGKVQFLGPNAQMTTMDTAGTGSLAAAGQRDGIYRSYGSFATYDIGKTLVAGGGSVTEGGQPQVPTRTAVTVDLNGGSTVLPTGSMALPRRQFDLTVLADGSVLATGGETKAVDGLVDLQNAAFAAERWDPSTGAWTTLAPAARVRQYHSTASLLPDGRVLTGGGGICGQCTTVGYLEKNVQYFTPPYLYKKDGSGQLASRPVIKDAPAAVSVGSRFVVTTATATSVQKVGIVRLGAPTHGVDQGQRYVPLTFSRSGNVITATAPATGDIAPPGYYMLFVTDAAGVPSVAKMIKIDSPQTASSAPVLDDQGRCLDTRGSAATPGTAVITGPCRGGVSQRWTYTGDDQSFRAQGLCLGVRGAVLSGTTTVATLCSHATAQRWERRTDGTIRPVSQPQLCLVADGRAAPDPVLIKVRTCSGAPTQQWTP